MWKLFCLSVTREGQWSHGITGTGARKIRIVKIRANCVRIWSKIFTQLNNFSKCFRKKSSKLRAGTEGHIHKAEKTRIPKGWKRTIWPNISKTRRCIVSPVVSSGHSHAFYVVYVLLEYVPTIPPHSTHFIVLFNTLKTLILCFFTS